MTFHRSLNEMENATLHLYLILVETIETTRKNNTVCIKTKIKYTEWFTLIQQNIKKTGEPITIISIKKLSPI